MSVRIGFIGTGGIAGAHMKNLRTFDDVEFAAMCDVATERAEAAAAEYGGQAYSDFRRMYDEADLDAVYICTPPFAHGDQEKLACAQGLPMFIEKPVALDLDTALDIEAHVRQSGVLTSVGYHWRYTGQAQYARTLLKSAGPVLGGLGYWMGGLPGTAWWRVRSQSGGQHVEQTTHVFDVARFLFDSEPIAVHGLAASGALADVPDYDIDDLSTVNIRFANGAAANITSCCALQGWRRVHMDVFCKDLVVTVGNGTLAVNRQGQDEVVPQLESQDRDRVFIDAVKSGDGGQILSPYGDAVKTLRLMLAASESFASGTVVELS